MNSLLRMFLWFKIRSLEFMINGRDSLRPLITDKLALANMDLLQDTALSELRRLKRKYEELSA